jgi:hypothetical protein
VECESTSILPLKFEFHGGCEKNAAEIKVGKFIRHLLIHSPMKLYLYLLDDCGQNILLNVAF